MCRLASRAYEHWRGLLRNRFLRCADRDCAPSVSILFWVLRVHQHSNHGIDIRRDRLNHKRRDKGIIDKSEPLGVPLQVTSCHLDISIWTRTWFNGEKVPSACLAVFSHPKTNAFADFGGV